MEPSIQYSMFGGATWSASDSWWRPEDAKIKDGMIVPVGRPTSYSPIAEFETFRNSNADNPDHRPPYVELSRALDEMETGWKNVEAAKDDPKTVDALAKDGVYDPVLAWVRRWGLLGLLLHEARTIVHPPVWVRVGKGLDSLAIVDERLDTGDWARYVCPEDDQSGAAKAKEGECSAAVPLRAVYSDILREPGEGMDEVVRYSRGLGRGEDYVRRYFPGGLAAQKGGGVFPRPDSPGFAGAYAEPVWGFLRAARMLKEGVRAFLEGPWESPDFTPWQLRTLAAPVAFRPTPALPGRVREGQGLSFVAPSLLSAMAAWATIDCTEPAHAFICEQCDRISASPARHSKFCSKQCRQLNAKQRERARAKVLALLVEGKSPAEIARAVGRELDEVNAWAKELKRGAGQLSAMARQKK